MARRFSDIKRAARLNEALEAYKAYLARPASTTLGAYTPREAPASLEIKPFGILLTGDAQALVSGNQVGFTRLGSVVAPLGRVATATTNAKPIIGFSPARVITFENTTKSATTATSKFTAQSYRKYNGDRFSCPFGQLTETSREIDVGNAVKAALRARTGLEVNRISITPERQKAR